MLKQITKERDSYPKALEITTKELKTPNTNQNDDTENTQQQQQPHVDFP